MIFIEIADNVSDGVLIVMFALLCICNFNFFCSLTLFYLVAIVNVLQLLNLATSFSACRIRCIPCRRLCTGSYSKADTKRL